MNARSASATGGGRRRVQRPPVDSGVIDLEALRITRALAARSRYKYVQPRVEREGTGWKIVSPNCSRNIDRSGGEIPIAWLQPTGGGRWSLHARDHAQCVWVMRVDDLSLPRALDLLCEDSAREFWP